MFSTCQNLAGIYDTLLCDKDTIPAFKNSQSTGEGGSLKNNFSSTTRYVDRCVHLDSENTEKGIFMDIFFILGAMLILEIQHLLRYTCFPFSRHFPGPGKSRR